MFIEVRRNTIIKNCFIIRKIDFTSIGSPGVPIEVKSQTGVGFGNSEWRWFFFSNYKCPTRLQKLSFQKKVQRHFIITEAEKNMFIHK